MSEQVARAHTSISNRAKPRDNADRKVLYRSVVGNPLRVQWPFVQFNIQNAILACVVDIVDGVATYHLSRQRAAHRKRRSSQSCGDDDALKKAQRLSGTAVALDAPNASARGACTPDPDVAEATSDNTMVAIPPALGSLTIGINAVTKRLEDLCNSHRSSVKAGNGDTARSDDLNRDRVVVACRADMDPPVLISHIPDLVAACNSRANASAGTTWLVPLPKGAEHTLAEALGLRRASVLLLEASAPRFASLEALLRNVPRLAAPWLEPTALAPAVALIPTHVKQVRTTAPKDMKAAKEKRIRERAAARTRRNSKMSTLPKHVTITPSS
ncbi:hypothetical protein OH77DRAFT_1417588 [Trametes cingulata]|nr:hypothetical protein OH77DRAFT_1417588 [Trametes cingulata]